MHTEGRNQDISRMLPSCPLGCSTPVAIFLSSLVHPFHPKDIAFSLAGLRRGAHIEYTPAYAALLLLTSHSDSVHACLRSATLFSSLPALAAEILPSQISSCLDATHRFPVLQHTRHFYLATFASSA